MDEQRATSSTPPSGGFSGFPFKYRDLDLDRPTFRLVRLFKGESSDCLGCEIFHASFCDRETSISYDALSYTWGDDEDRRILYVRGGRLEVTPNLYVALEALRSSTQDRILWIDALCINQNSPGERQHQVGQMGRIYGNADAVLFWLGPSTSATNIALESLKRLQEKSVMLNCRAWDRKDHRWDKLWSDLLPGLEDTYPDLLSRQRKGLEDLLSRSWFERVWILQEVAKSKKALVCCGEMFVSARIFTVAPRLFGVEPSPHCQAVLDIMPGPSRQNSWWSEKPDLYTLLKKFCRSKASDPRDMIFALLGLASDAQADGFPSANYNQNEVDVIREVLCFMFSVSSFYVPVSADKDNRLHRHLPRFFDPEDEDNWFHGVLAARAISISQFLSSLDSLSNADDGINSRLSDGPEKLRKASTVPAQYLRRREIWDVLSQRCSNIYITDKTVEAAARNEGGKEGLELLLKRPPNPIEITQGVIEAAAANNGGGNEIMTFLLQKRGHETITAAARSSQGKDMIIRLLRNEMTLMTDEIIDAAKKCWHPSALRRLFEKIPHTITITESMMKVAAEKSNASALEPLLRERGHEITITEEIVKAGARNPNVTVLQLLLREKGHEITITEEVVKAAARNLNVSVLQLLLRERGHEITITEEIVKAAARRFNELGLQFLLQERGHEITITEEVVKVAAQNSNTSVLQFLLQERGYEIIITREIVQAAVRNSNVLVLRLLLWKRGHEITVTEEIRRAAARDLNVPVLYLREKRARGDDDTGRFWSF